MRASAVVRPRLPALTTLPFLLLAACAGSMGGEEPPAPGGSGGAGAGMPPAPGTSGGASGTSMGGGALPPEGPRAAPDVVGAIPACAARRIGPSPLRRLTHLEYANTVRDLLGDAGAVASTFPPDRNPGGGFSNEAIGLQTSPLLAEGYQAAAEKLAAVAARNLKTLLPCDPAAANETCIKQLVEQLGKKAYRRPLDAAEVTGLLDVYRSARGNGADLAGGVGDVVETMLQSPWFLYRVELGNAAPAGTAVPLTQHEIAARLSYGLWATMPDKDLFAAADAGMLRTADQIAAQARRLLADPRSREAVDTFYREWLEVGRVEAATKDAKMYPEWTAELRTAMRQEMSGLVDEILRKGDGRLASLFATPVSFVTPALAKLYGVPGVTSTTASTRVMLDPNQRPGILTRGAFLAANGRADGSDPIHRGLFVVTKVMCDTLAPPPGDVMDMIPPPSSATTTRQRFADHRKLPQCQACHVRIDELGFGFESYDGIGKFRTTESGRPVDDSGEIVGSRFAELNGKFKGARELSAKLADSEAARSCAVMQGFRYLMGRGDTDDDTCSLEVANKLLARSSHDLRELMVALTQTDAFLYRSAGGTP